MMKKQDAISTVTRQALSPCSLTPRWQDQCQSEQKVSEGKPAQLEVMASYCQTLGAEVRYHPAQRYFTAMVWIGWGLPYNEGPALAVQQKIQQKAAQYPDLVCYCFDPFSTLIYAI